ncbi:MAG: hypothetical protein CVU89_08920 [Firmicutes bacterium HGW-Firmicutes-14]|nr:MAG: hypothetical protein CVU89_08920 [Firmicutes bacterium HGW-Firmicutes-14]
MREVIREYIGLSQSFALLPLKFVRGLIDDKNTNAKLMVDMFEDFVSIPFVAAARAVDNSQNSGSGNGQDSLCFHSRGPGMHNVWVNPQVTVSADSETEDGRRTAVLNVTGLLCGG